MIGLRWGFRDDAVAADEAEDLPEFKDPVRANHFHGSDYFICWAFTLRDVFMENCSMVVRRRRNETSFGIPSNGTNMTYKHEQAFSIEYLQS